MPGKITSAYMPILNGIYQLPADCAEDLAATVNRLLAAIAKIGQSVTAGLVSADAPSSGHYGDFAYIDLDAGEWDVTCSGEIVVPAGTVMTNFNFGLSTMAGDTGAGWVAGDSKVAIYNGTSATDASGCVAAYPLRLDTPARIYFKGGGTYTGTAPHIGGRLSARRAAVAL